MIPIKDMRWFWRNEIHDTRLSSSLSRRRRFTLGQYGGQFLFWKLTSCPDERLSYDAFYKWSSQPIARWQLIRRRRCDMCIRASYVACKSENKKHQHEKDRRSQNHQRSKKINPLWISMSLPILGHMNLADHWHPLSPSVYEYREDKGEGIRTPPWWRSIRRSRQPPGWNRFDRMPY